MAAKATADRPAPADPPTPKLRVLGSCSPRLQPCLQQRELVWAGLVHGRL